MFILVSWGICVNSLQTQMKTTVPTGGTLLVVAAPFWRMKMSIHLQLICFPVDIQVIFALLDLEFYKKAVSLIIMSAGFEYNWKPTPC